MNQNDASSLGCPGLADRQAAERKLCRFFKSFGVDAMARRDRLIDPYLDRAQAYWRPHAGTNFAVLVEQEAESDLEAWFAQVLGDRVEDRASAIMTGRAAYLMCNGPADWADQLLMPVEDLPEAFVRALADEAPCAVPPSDFGEMRHQPYEAWSPTALVALALPTDGSLFQSFGWRDTGQIR